MNSVWRFLLMVQSLGHFFFWTDQTWAPVVSPLMVHVCEEMSHCQTESLVLRKPCVVVIAQTLNDLSFTFGHCCCPLLWQGKSRLRQPINILMLGQSESLSTSETFGLSIDEGWIEFGHLAAVEKLCCLRHRQSIIICLHLRCQTGSDMFWCVEWTVLICRSALFYMRSGSIVEYRYRLSTRAELKVKNIRQE